MNGDPVNKVIGNMISYSDAKQKMIIFIVGNSRSGTTLMMRILDQHPKVYGVNEGHFFEKLWSSNDKNRILTDIEAIQMVAHLLSIQRDGYIQKFYFEKHQQEAIAVVNSIKQQSLTIINVFSVFLLYEAQLRNKSIPCEKTPQNVFYLKEILELFPEAKVINMIRDPRAVLLSQKNKGRRGDRAEYGRYRTKREDLRLQINYHPITISRLWNSAVEAAIKYHDHPNVINVRFEDLLENVDAEMQKVCAFLGINYDIEMTKIAAVGSSNVKDNLHEKGIKTERVNTWKQGGLEDTEIFLCQNITHQFRKQFGYESLKIQPNYLQLFYYYISLPVKLFLSLVFNLNRMRNVKDAIMRRLGRNI